MKPRDFYINKLCIYLLGLFAITLSACRPALMKNQTIELANSIENSVQVSILMSRDEKNQLTLSAVFTPQNPGLHLYSKDIPKNGVDGLGRPTLL
jgi:hypothetical protein